MTTLINLSDITPPPMVESVCPCYGECCDEYHLKNECSCDEYDNTPKNTKQTEWKGRLGCYCAECWEFCKMGSYDEWLERYPNINTPKNTELELINVNSGLYSVRGNTHSNEQLATMIYDKMEEYALIDIENKELLKTYLIKLSALAIGEEYWTHYNTPSSPNAIEFEIKKVIDNNLLLKGKDEAIKKRLIKRSKYLTDNYGV